MEVFNEKDLINLRLSTWKDEKGAALAPGAITSLWYRVDETGSGQNQVPQTNVAPAEPTDISVTSAQNVMADVAREKEIVTITVHFEWGANKGKTKTYLFQRNNLRFFS